MADYINGDSLAALLNRVHLKGLIEECLLKVKKGVGTIQAVDMSNSIFISCREKLEGIDDMEIGLGSLSVLCRYLDSGGDVSFMVKDKWLHLRRKKQGLLKTLLLQPEEVPTLMERGGAEQKVVDACDREFAITEDAVDNYTYYMGLVGSEGTVVKLKGGRVSLCSKLSESQQFNMPIGICEGGTEFKTEVYSQHLLAVLRELTWGDKSPKMLIGENAPIVVKQNDYNIWALTPVAAEE